MTRRTLFALGACLLFVAPGAQADSERRVVKVVTRNMDAGTDLGWFFVIPDVMTATSLTLSEVLASNIPGRAELLADEIGSEQPDLIALEEVTLWESGPPGAAGYTDAWRVLNPPGTGFTWPLFLEDFLSGTSVVPFERIDLIFARDLNVTSVQQSGLLPPWPSDHVGVVATLQLQP